MIVRPNNNSAGGAGKAGKRRGNKQVVFSSLVKQASSEDLFYRPKLLGEIIGREREKKVLNMMIDSVKKQWKAGKSVALDHILLYGPPGVGKTTMALAIANELGVKIVITSGRALERAVDLVSILTNLNEGDILFIDEIHRLKPHLEEVLYPAMEDYALDIVTGTAQKSRSIRLSLKPFTLIGATTRVGMLSSPFRDRFGVSFYLDLLDPPQLVEILENVVQRDPNIQAADHAALEEIARRSRGTARVAVKFYKRIRDYAIAGGKSFVSLEMVKEVFKMLGVDSLGLDVIDRKLLKAIITEFGGGPVGLKALAGYLGEDASTIEEVYEPYLLKIGFIAKTPRGRVATASAYKHLNIEPPNPTLI